MPQDKLPILVVDFKQQDRARIRYACLTFRVRPTDEQADQIAAYLHPLPDDDDVLVDQVSECIAIDWGEIGKEPDEALRNLTDQLSKAKNPHTRKRIEQEMHVATRGLAEHPEWFDGPCMCDACRSCG